MTIAGIVAGVYISYRFFLPAIVPFLAAALLAGWFYPISVKIEKRTKIKKGISGAVLITMFLAAIGLFLYWGITEIFRQMQTAAANVPCFLYEGESAADKCCRTLEKLTGIEGKEYKKYFLKYLKNITKSIFSFINIENIGKIVGMAKKVILCFSGFVVTYISSIFIISDMENIRKKIRDYSWIVGIRRALLRLKKTTAVYFKAQIVIMGVIAAVCTVGFWMMHSSYFLIFGISLGLLDAIPLIGTGTILYPAAVVCLIRGQIPVAVGCVLLDLVTSFLREVMEAKMLGGKFGVSPLVILACVYLGVLIFGGKGVILGPLAFSTAYELGKEWDTWD